MKPLQQRNRDQDRPGVGTVPTFQPAAASTIRRRKAAERLTFTAISAVQENHFIPASSSQNAAAAAPTLITKAAAYFSCDKCFRIRVSFLMASPVAP